jgi:hypothetical protein
MISLDRGLPPSPLKHTEQPFERVAPALYATTLFVSALLLFGV